MKEVAKFAMIPLAVVLWIAYDKFGREPTGAGPPAQPADAAALELGQKYRADLAGAMLSALDAGASSTASSTAEFARTQDAAIEAAFKAAGAPIAAEMDRRFGPPSDVKYAAEVDLAKFKAFYRDLAAGFRKGAK